MNPHNRKEAYATVDGFTFDVKFCSLTKQVSTYIVAVVVVCRVTYHVTDLYVGVIV